MFDKLQLMWPCMQILKLNEKAVVATLVREQIDIQDRIEKERSEMEGETEKHFRQITGTEHVSLSSALKPCTLEYLEDQLKHDSAFKGFQKRLAKSLTAIFTVRIQLDVTEEVQYN